MNIECPTFESGTFRRKTQTISGRELTVALPRGTRVSSNINNLQKGLGRTRCITFQCVSGSPPKPFSLTAQRGDGTQDVGGSIRSPPIVPPIAVRRESGASRCTAGTTCDGVGRRATHQPTRGGALSLPALMAQVATREGVGVKALMFTIMTAARAASALVRPGRERRAYAVHSRVAAVAVQRCARRCCHERPIQQTSQAHGAAGEDVTATRRRRPPARWCHCARERQRER